MTHDRAPNSEAARAAMARKRNRGTSKSTIGRMAGNMAGGAMPALWDEYQSNTQPISMSEFHRHIEHVAEIAVMLAEQIAARVDDLPDEES